MTLRAAPSETTARARALVAQRRTAATALGREAGEHVGDPTALMDALRSGLQALADPAYREEMGRVAPGIGPILGVRQPLLHAVGRGLATATRHDRSSTVIDVAQLLLRADLLEVQWLALGLLERTIREEPERSWQLVRAAARRADDWITVDTLAHVAARGVLGEPYRWAELEQLVYSPSRWERRLVGSTIAALPTTDRTLGRTPEVARHGLAIVRDLIGDADPEVQKSLAWALRSLSVVDPSATIAFLRTEAASAARNGDGHRAWVIRDSLEKLPGPVASELRAALDGVRKRRAAPSTSRAAETAGAFIGLGIAVPPAERPVIERP